MLWNLLHESFLKLFGSRHHTAWEILAVLCEKDSTFTVLLTQGIPCESSASVLRVGMYDSRLCVLTTQLLIKWKASSLPRVDPAYLISHWVLWILPWFSFPLSQLSVLVHILMCSHCGYGYQPVLLWCGHGDFKPRQQIPLSSERHDPQPPHLLYLWIPSIPNYPGIPWRNPVAAWGRFASCLEFSAFRLCDSHTTLSSVL